MKYEYMQYAPPLGSFPSGGWRPPRRRRARGPRRRSRWRRRSRARGSRFPLRYTHLHLDLAAFSTAARPPPCRHHKCLMKVGRALSPPFFIYFYSKLSLSSPPAHPRAPCHCRFPERVLPRQSPPVCVEQRRPTVGVNGGVRAWSATEGEGDKKCRRYDMCDTAKGRSTPFVRYSVTIINRLLACAARQKENGRAKTNRARRRGCMSCGGDVVCHC